MYVSDLKSLVCSNHHSFDFTKQGYINLYTQQVKTKYNKALFEARRKVIVEGEFFTPLTEAITKIIQKHTVAQENLNLIDTGCGEGSHLVTVGEALRSHKSVTGVGIDLAKEGILVAAKHYPNYIWCVADLANTPFKDNHFDVILNILSPSNYAEFGRLLTKEGFVVKVVPQQKYLQELRGEFLAESAQQEYSNRDVVDRFQEEFQLVDRSRITYTKNLDQAMLEALVTMTPLTWRSTEKEKKAFLQKESAEITVDVDILIGRNN